MSRLRGEGEEITAKVIRSSISLVSRGLPRDALHVLGRVNGLNGQGHPRGIEG